MSFDELVRRHRAEVLAYLVRLLGDRDDAEDACQDALIRAHRAYARLDSGANRRAWLYRIATRSGLNTKRARARRSARLADVDPEVLGSFGDDALRERVRIVTRVVGRLPPKQRAALMQRRFHGFDYDEIGRMLNCGPTAARANVYQAIKKLRHALADVSKSRRSGEDSDEGA